MRPRVFISSTFYDLRQVRDDLRAFIDQLGYQPMVSEHYSFPINPGDTTVENCRRQVEENADLFVLIVGARYGSRDPASNRSVTNIEYLAARAKGIPIYVFMEKGLEPLLKLWKKNPGIDLSSEIETPDLFRFLDEIRTTHKVWTSTFERASEITEALRTQFAYLMAEGLKWQLRLDQRPRDSYVRKLSGLSLRIALERPPGWEYLVLAQVIRDEVAASRHLREEHDEALALELGEDVAEAAEWPAKRLNELERLIETLSPIMDTIATRAVGAPGQSGNADEIAFAGRAIGRVYASALTWSRRVRTANLPSAMNDMRSILVRFTDAVIAEIEGHPDRLEAIIRDALDAPATGPTREITIALRLTLPDGLVEEFNREMRRLLRIADENGGWA